MKEAWERLETELDELQCMGVTELHPAVVLGYMHFLKQIYQREEMKGRIIKFDTDGITSHCPIWGRGVLQSSCQGCNYYRGSQGFDVFCAYLKEV